MSHSHCLSHAHCLSLTLNAVSLLCVSHFNCLTLSLSLYTPRSTHAADEHFIEMLMQVRIELLWGFQRSDPEPQPVCSIIVSIRIFPLNRSPLWLCTRVDLPFCPLRAQERQSKRVVLSWIKWLPHNGCWISGWKRSVLPTNRCKETRHTTTLTPQTLQGGD